MSAASDILEQKIGYAFKDAGLLDAALTHSSMQRKAYNNERLEFLGDRVLGLVVADLLYRSFPGDKEGALAKRHTALVRQKALVNVAEKIELSAHIRLSAGEKKAGGHQKETILSDALEALIGAVYLDGGYPAAEKMVTLFWQNLVEPHVPPEDPKSQLQEWAQGRGLALPDYRVVSKSGSDHAPVFEIEVVVEGHGTVFAKAASKRQAERAAAALMLKKIEEAK